MNKKQKTIKPVRKINKKVKINEQNILNKTSTEEDMQKVKKMSSGKIIAGVISGLVTLGLGSYGLKKFRNRLYNNNDDDGHDPLDPNEMDSLRLDSSTPEPPDFDRY